MTAPAFKPAGCRHPGAGDSRHIFCGQPLPRPAPHAVHGRSNWGALALVQPEPGRPAPAHHLPLSPLADSHPRHQQLSLAKALESSRIVIETYL